MQLGLQLFLTTDGPVLFYKTKKIKIIMMYSLIDSPPLPNSFENKGQRPPP